MAAYPERGVGNDPEPLGVAFLQGPPFTSDLFTPDNAKEEWQVLKEEFEAKKSICVALRKRNFKPKRVFASCC